MKAGQTGRSSVVFFPVELTSFSTAWLTRTDCVRVEGGFLRTLIGWLVAFHSVRVRVGVIEYQVYLI